MIDVADLRERHANAIRNTATGKALGAALDEVERLRQRQRPETKVDVRRLVKEYAESAE